MKTINIRVDDEFHRKIKQISKKTGISITALVVQGLKLRINQLEQPEQGQEDSNQLP